MYNTSLIQKNEPHRMIPVRKNKVATNLKVHILQWVCPYHCMLLFHCVSNTKYTHYPTQFDRITCTISFYVTYFLWSLPVYFVRFDHTIACRQVQKLGIKDKRGKKLCFLLVFEAGTIFQQVK